MILKPLIAAALLSTTAIAAPALAGDKYKTETKVMGATETGPNIVETAMDVDALSTLVAAVKAAELVEALSGDGPFTVFAPTNDAFGALPAGTVESLLEPANKDKLSKILTAHVVSGSLDAASVIALAEANGGEAEVTTLSGDTLIAYAEDGKVYVKDENGGKAMVATADVATSNGVVHVVDAVLLPN
ncbi:fasciclin domain-containing protein [uncultured Algimonas sp.]|uniref:fasciclin domain-containing protein n=1 Tax=uncultured Algimonas sp. TaxID=1547920 RepID=UPI00260C4AB8|nr:fasciclin domain-containing protein [uncultured Algimonas sp.]